MWGSSATGDDRAVLDELDRTVYDGITADELSQALVMAARSLVEREPNYSAVASGLLLAAWGDDVLHM